MDKDLQKQLKDLQTENNLLIEKNKKLKFSRNALLIYTLLSLIVMLYNAFAK